MFAKVSSLVSVLVLALAITSVTAQSCAEAARYGLPTISPSTGLQPGDTANISTNFECSYYFGIEPTYTSYWISVIPSPGHATPTFLANRKPQITEAQPWDNFTITIPDSYWLPNTTSYPITLWTYYEEAGPDGGSFLTQGDVESAMVVTIASTSEA